MNKIWLDIVESKRGSDRDKVWTNMNVIIGSIASASLLHFPQCNYHYIESLSYAFNVVVIVVVVFVTTVRTITIYRYHLTIWKCHIILIRFIINVYLFMCVCVCVLGVFWIRIQYKYRSAYIHTIIELLVSNHIRSVPWNPSSPCLSFIF